MAKRNSPETEIKQQEPENNEIPSGITDSETTKLKEEATENNLDDETQNPEAKTCIVLLAPFGTKQEIIDLSITQWEKHAGNYDLQVCNLKNGDIDVQVAEALSAIIADETVSEKFIVTPVTTFPVNELSDEDFELMLCKGELKDKGISCLRFLPEVAVAKQLKKEGITVPINYETGLPVLLEKEKAVEILEKFNPVKYPTKVFSLYLNYFNRGEKPMPVAFNVGGYATGVWRKNPRMEIIGKTLKEGKFLLVNDEGYNAVKDFFQ